MDKNKGKILGFVEVCKQRFGLVSVLIGSDQSDKGGIRMGTEYGLLGLAVALLVCLSIGRLCLYYRRRQAKLTHQTERWNEIVAMAELMVFDYDVMADELMLTDPCARLFRLPTRQKHYTDLRQKKLDAQKREQNY